MKTDDEEEEVKHEHGEEEHHSHDSDNTNWEYCSDRVTETQKSIFKQKTVDFKEEEDEPSNGEVEDDELTQAKAATLMAMSIRSPKKVTLQDFDILCLLGKGTFGKVYLTRLDFNENLYAIKCIRKDRLLETGQVESTKLEQDILLSCDHPFLVSMDYVFQNELRLYFAMSYLPGGELYKHYLNKRCFTEEETKFYIIQVIQAIGYLHSQKIVHRDLKLENILVQKDGYLKIIDFGLAKMLQEDFTKSYCGTAEYIAPEMIGGEGYDQMVDWWSVGILIYEMLFGITPFYNRSRQAMKFSITKHKIKFPKRTETDYYTDEARDIIVAMLNKDPT